MRKNAINSKPAIPWLSLGLLAVLLCLAPYAMTFAPHGAYFAGETLHAPDSPDSLYAIRELLILFGLLATVVTFFQFVRSFSRGPSGLVSAAPSLAAFFACAVVGWRSFPYWVMGVYQVSIGAFSLRDQDPKSMIPMTWLSELWRGPVLLLSLLCWVVLPGLAVVAGVLAWRRQFAAAGITAACAGVALLFKRSFSPDYGVWLMD